MDIDNLAVNAIRVISAEAIEKARSGHPGLPLGSAPIAYTLFSKFLKFLQKLRGTVDFCDERMIHQLGRFCQEKSYNFGIPHNPSQEKAYNLTKLRGKLYAV